MKALQLATRYAKALFAVAQEAGVVDRVIAELRGLAQVFSQDEAIKDFLSSPLYTPEVKEKFLAQALAADKISTQVRDFTLLLARRSRLNLFDTVVDAYEKQTDGSHGVTRGVVESAINLGPEERRGIEKIVKKVTNKDVILNYKLNPQIIGGLVARVGSYTFDDSIRSHLRRLNEDLKRRTI